MEHEFCQAAVFLECHLMYGKWAYLYVTRCLRGGGGGGVRYSANDGLIGVEQPALMPADCPGCMRTKAFWSTGNLFVE